MAHDHSDEFQRWRYCSFRGNGRTSRKKKRLKYWRDCTGHHYYSSSHNWYLISQKLMSYRLLHVAKLQSHGLPSHWFITVIILQLSIFNDSPKRQQRSIGNTSSWFWFQRCLSIIGCPPKLDIPVCSAVLLRSGSNKDVFMPLCERNINSFVHDLNSSHPFHFPCR